MMSFEDFEYILHSIWVSIFTTYLHYILFYLNLDFIEQNYAKRTRK